ncbi:accessory gene regulator B family protein [Clostridiaceae bacterium 35-E11]
MAKLIDKIMAVYKKHLDIDQRQEAILRYSLKLLIGSVAGYALALVMAWPLDIFYPVLVVMTMVSVLRVFSGGAHCSNALNCIVYGAIIMNALGLLTEKIAFSTTVGLIMLGGIFFYALWCIGRYAPADTPGKPISTKQQQDKLKKRSVAVVCIWAFIVFRVIYQTTGQVHPLVYASSIGILWQSFSLTKGGYQFCHALDKLLSRILDRKGAKAC